MYPRVSDFINDVFGTSINLPIQSYGFFLASAFFVGAWLLRSELGRKSKEGLITETIKKVRIGKPASVIELVLTFVVSLLVGYKLVGIFVYYNTLLLDPQGFIFSKEGSILGGIIVALIMTYYQYYSKNKKKLDTPIWEEKVVPARDQVWPVVFIAVVFGIIGAKIFHQLENFNDFLADPVGSLLSFSGLTFYGGLIIAAFAVAYFGEKNGIPWKHMADSIAPSLIISYGIGRIGCQVSGDGDWGIVNTAPQPEWLSFLPDWTWSYTYPHNILNRGFHIDGCSGSHCFELAQSVFPTPIYETSMALLIFAFLWYMRKRISVPGVLFAIYLMLNGVERFFIEKIRVNNLMDFIGMRITQAELISTLIFLTGLVMFIVFYINNKKNSTYESGIGNKKGC